MVGGIGDWLTSLFGGTPTYTPTQTAPSIPATLPGAPGYSPQSSLAGLLDPAGIRQQAAWSGLGALSQGLLAAGMRRPAGSPSPLPQAFGAFQPAYAQGIQSGGQMAALEQQARDQQLLNQARASNPQYRNLPTAALVAQLSRAQGRALLPAEITAAGLTPGLPWQIDQNGMYSVPSHDPRVQYQGARATAAGDVEVRGVDLGQTGVRGYPDVSRFAPPGTGGPPAVTPPAVQPSVGGPRPQRPLAGGQPGVDRPFTADDILRTSPDMSREDAETTARSANEIYPVTPRAAPAQGGQVPRTTDPQMRTVPGGRVYGADPQAVVRARGAAETQDRYTRETIIPQINNGVQSIDVVRRMREQAADPTMQFGPGAGAANSVAQFLRSWGGDAGRALADRVQSEGFSVLEGLSTQQLLAQLGGSLGPGISNTDVTTIARTVPNPFQSRETFTRFLDLIESRALSNMHTAHGAYRRTVPDWNPDTDPISAHLFERLDALGIDTAPFIAQRSPRGGTQQPPAPRPQATPPTSERRIGDTATNPQTGAQVRWDGIRWVPVQPGR